MRLSSTIKIILVEDSDEIRESLKLVLRKKGFKNISDFRNAEFALDSINKDSSMGNQIDLIVSDWHLPKMSGLQLLENIRANPLLTQTPFIMVTAECDRENVMQALKLGANNYVVKPISGSILIQKITETFEKLKKIA